MSGLTSFLEKKKVVVGTTTILSFYIPSMYGHICTRVVGILSKEDMFVNTRD